MGGILEPLDKASDGCNRWLQILYFNGLDRFSELESKHFRVEIKLSIKRSFDVFRLPETMLLAGKRNV